MRLAELLVSIGLEAKGLRRLNQQLGETQRNFRRSFGNIQKGLQSFGKTATVAITAPLVGAAYKSIEAFNQQAKAIAQVEQGLKSTGNTVGFTSQQLQQMASNLQRQTIFGDEEILQGATAQLLTFTNIAGEQFQRTQVAALDLATRLDGDLKSASIQLGKALNDPIANLSALARSGIQFSAEQKETIKSLAETNRLAEAQTLILDELEKQYGGSAEAAAKAGTGPIKQLQNSLGDLSEQFGAILVDALQPLVAMATKVVNAFANMSTGTKRMILVIAGVLGAAGPIALAVAALMPIIGALTGPIGLVALAVAAMVTMVIRNLNTVIPAFVKVINEVIKFQNKTKALGLVFGVIKTIVVGLFRLMEVNFLNLVDIVGSVGEAVNLALDGEFSQAGDVIAGSISRGKDRFIEFGADMATDFTKEFEDAMNAEDIELLEADSILGMIDDVKDKFSTAFQQQGPVEIPVTPQPKMSTMSSRGPGGGGLVPTGLAAGTAAAAVGVSQLNDGVAVSVDLANNAASAFNALGDAIAGIATGTVTAGQFMASMLTQLADMLGQIGTQFIAAGVAAMQFYANLIANPAAAVAAGVGLVVASKLIGALGQRLAAEPPALATGGLAFGPTLATVGDNPNARVNPEVIAPLDKLKSMMGGDRVTVTGRLDGRDILISSERAGFDRNRVRGF